MASDVVVGEVQRLGRAALGDRLPQELAAGVDVAVVCGNLCCRSPVERLPGIPVIEFVFRFIQRVRIGLRRLLEIHIPLFYFFVPNQSTEKFRFSGLTNSAASRGYSVAWSRT